MERQKIDERIILDFDEKERIAAKSEHKCCHCGKLAYFSYGATIDHYIPLSKGGTNDDANLIMLCEDCNHNKDNLIIPPKNYIIFLDDDHKTKLQTYFDNYVKKYDYISRQNILSYDLYKLSWDDIMAMNGMHLSYYKDAVHRKLKQLGQEILFKKASVDDIPRLVYYYGRYLRKCNKFHNSREIDIVVRFWYQFGCIYYMEFNDEIRIIMPITIMNSHSIDDDEFDKEFKAISISIFPCRDHLEDFICATSCIRTIVGEICSIQKLPFVQVCVNMIKDDKLSDHIFSIFPYAFITDDGMIHSLGITHSGSEHKLSKDDINNENKKKYVEFCNKFNDINDEIEAFIEKEEDLEFLKTYFSTDYLFDTSSELLISKDHKNAETIIRDIKDTT